MSETFPDPSWSDSLVEKLRIRWLANWPIREIVADLGKSKGAIVGKAQRIGLPMHASAPRAQERKQHDDPPESSTSAVSLAVEPSFIPTLRHIRHPVTQKVRHAPQIARGGACHHGEPKMSADQPFEPKMVAIRELKDGVCRWPIGDPTTDEFRYCGSATPAGPYCPHHRAIAYESVADRRRNREQRVRVEQDR